MPHDALVGVCRACRPRRSDSRLPTSTLRYPVLPNPPRVGVAISATSCHSIAGAGRTMPCAMRSPRRTRTGSLGDVEHLDLYLVVGPAVVRVDHAHPVGDDQAALQGRAAAREDPQEVAARHGNHESRPDQPDLPRRNLHVSSRGEIEPGGAAGGGRGQGNGRVQTLETKEHGKIVQRLSGAGAQGCSGCRGARVRLRD